MKVLIVGSGGREHALAWRIRQSHQLTELWVAGGNAGTAQIATNLDINPDHVDAVEACAKSLKVDLVVVGPEVPLSLGLVDHLEEIGIPAFGPSQAAARLESSKSFARDVIQSAGVAGPEYRVFQDQQEALDFVRNHDAPLVVKADGLAAGKGVMMCPTADDAFRAVQSCMEQRAFGQAGETIVIEELLYGREVSVFGFTDGQHLSSLVAACDYKRVGDGDLGPNTGGMGSFSPPVFWCQSLAETVARDIMQPVIQEMARRGTPYRGVLYAGLMLTEQGLKVIEFNCRFGDPETQVIMPLLETDPLDVMLACSQRRLAEVPVRWGSQPHVAVIMTSGGYPDKYQTGYEIIGLESRIAETMIFHAGTKLADGQFQRKVLTNGGRVLAVVGKGDTLEEARLKAYQRAESVHFENRHYRRDIASLIGTNEGESWAPGVAPMTG